MKRRQKKIAKSNKIDKINNNQEEEESLKSEETPILS